MLQRGRRQPHCANPFLQELADPGGGNECHAILIKCLIQVLAVGRGHRESEGRYCWGVHYNLILEGVKLKRSCAGMGCG